MPLPSEIYIPAEFSAGDTTYLRVNPIWDDTYGFQSPVEITIALDGHIFVADSAASRIFVLEPDGSVLNDFTSLIDLKDENGNNLAPIDVDVDQKMNIFFIDGSRKVYRWNQLWNDLGIDSVASATLKNITTEDTTTVIIGSDEWLELITSSEWSEWNVTSIHFSKNEAMINSLLKPHLWFDAGSPGNEEADRYYAGSSSLYSGLSVSNDEYIYVTDIYHNRIVKVDYWPSHLLKLGTGDTVWTHLGTFGNTVSGFGTGAGTVNSPLAIDVDFAGNIYYAQSGEFFSIHKIKPTLSEGYTNYPSLFQQGVNDIMDLWRFLSPADVAVDFKQFIYVANTGAREIQVFDSDGNFFKKAGIIETTVDTTIWIYSGTDSVAVDTFLTVEEKGILESPRAVTVDDRGVIYICDSPNSRIIRYRLSTSVDENLIPDE